VLYSELFFWTNRDHCGLKNIWTLKLNLKCIRKQMTLNIKQFDFPLFTLNVYLFYCFGNKLILINCFW